MLGHVRSAKKPSNTQELEKYITVKDLGESTYDVFRGDGWYNWSRFQRQGKILKLLKGNSIESHEYDYLLTVCK